MNVVVMRSTADQIDGVIDFVRSLNSEGHPGTAYVSLLDFYYSEERRSFWQQEFLPIEELIESLAARYGAIETHERFGCRFFWIDADGVKVRFKDSFGATTGRQNAKVVVATAKKAYTD